MRKAARTITIYDQHILLIKRDKFNLKYYTLPGGEVEAGEAPEQAALRELQEETNLVGTQPKLVFVEDAGAPYGLQYIYISDYQGGDMKLSPESIEAILNTNGQNTYQPVWVPLNQFADLPFRSKVLQAAILKGLRQGWPAEPEMLKSQAEISTGITDQKGEK